MMTRLLIDAIVRQTTSLLAQLSTAAGIRAPLSSGAERVLSLRTLAAIALATARKMIEHRGLPAHLAANGQDKRLGAKRGFCRVRVAPDEPSPAEGSRVWFYFGQYVETDEREAS